VYTITIKLLQFVEKYMNKTLGLPGGDGNSDDGDGVGTGTMMVGIETK